MPDISKLLEPEIPRLPRYTRALARDPVSADDLVQSCRARAIAKQHLWPEGTDLRAWLLTILHNQHVSEVRRSARAGVAVSVEDLAGAQPVKENATALLQLRDLDRAIGRLCEQQRKVVLLVGLHRLRYEQVALILDIRVGTVRSRLSRKHNKLRALMQTTAALPRRSGTLSTQHAA
ncbi:MAG: sigma-70 family RNA polymerase sigma factor [Alphaproteobacteria bacterium]|nr:sigma-70 family RNA polymerase sigma factor [Alphaproteobacteria bacterium]